MLNDQVTKPAEERRSVLTEELRPDSTLGAVSILVREYAGFARRDEPVSVSVPLAAGQAQGAAHWRLSDPTDKPVPCQTRVLATWPDGSVKWLHCTFLASVAANMTVEYCLTHHNGLAEVFTGNAGSFVLRVEHRPSQSRGATDVIQVDTGVARFSCTPIWRSILQYPADSADLLFKLEMWLHDSDMRDKWARCEHVAIETLGPVMAVVMIQGSFVDDQGWLFRNSRLRFRAILSFFVGLSQVRVALSIENPSRAMHRGGYWDLGDSGSAVFRGLRVLGRQMPGDANLIHWREEKGAASKKATDCSVSIVQDSSGGENWHSRNHLNQEGKHPFRSQGYRVLRLAPAVPYQEDEHRSQEAVPETKGMRALPIIHAQAEAGSVVGIAPLDFWQKCPAALSANEVGLSWEPFSLASGSHELQSGEHSTHIAWLDFAPPGDVDPCQRLAWAHVPLEVRCAPQVYAESGAVPYLPDEKTPPRPELATLLHDALEGPRNFFAKREVVDEYGWRNYGDTWADHEEVHYPGPHKPIISHYNNQFDILHGFLVEYLRSGDRRWWELADPLARHVMDIDIYHTDRDKAAYNGGLFWPTTHYYDAGTSTHRSMARAMGATGTTGGGGGPGAEHNFTSGLLLYHYLTGDERARESVIGLADWVIAMDDGEQHVLGLLSSQPTGVATLTNAPGYDGPGRGAANSIMALADGYRATGDEKYLDKADELIRRTIHPRDVIADRQFENQELRWSYTMHLQALVRYLEVITLPRPLPDREGSCLPGREGIARYVKQSVLHYARWMAEHEQFVLDHPEKLQYPTETWAAQELRKGNVLLMAARLAEGIEAETFVKRGKYFLDRAWESLLSFPTRDYTRPLALVLTQGYIETALNSGASSLPQFNIPDGPIEPADPQKFISQKEDIRRAMKSPRGLARMALRAASPARWARVLRRTWLAERVRTTLQRI